jgi:hypothetical protein
VVSVRRVSVHIAEKIIIVPIGPGGLAKPAPMSRRSNETKKSP